MPKFAKLKARKWKGENDGESSDGPWDDSDSDGADDDPFRVRGQRARRSPHRPTASTTRAKHWAKLRLSTKIFGRMQGIAHHEQQRLQQSQAARDLYKNRVTDFLNQNATRLSLAASRTRTNKKKTHVDAHRVTRITDSGVLATSGPIDPMASNLVTAMDMLPHQASSRLSGAGSHHDHSTNHRATPLQKSRLKTKPGKLKATESKPRLVSRASMGTVTSAVANRNRILLRKQEQAAETLQRLKEQEQTARIQKTREFREKEHRVLEEKHRQIQAHKLASEKGPNEHTDGRFKTMQLDSHLETPHFIMNALGSPTHALAAAESAAAKKLTRTKSDKFAFHTPREEEDDPLEEKRTPPMKSASTHQQVGRRPESEAGDETGVDGDGCDGADSGSNGGELDASAAQNANDASDSTAAEASSTSETQQKDGPVLKKSLTKKQLREAAQKAARVARLAKKRSKVQAKADKAARLARKAAEPERKARAKAARKAAARKAAHDKLMADMKGLEFTDGWSDDEGFEVDDSLMQLPGYESPAEGSSDSEEDGPIPGVDSTVHGKHAVRLPKPADGFNNNDLKTRSNIASESFRRYNEPALLLPVLAATNKERSSQASASRSSAQAALQAARSGAIKPQAVHQAEARQRSIKHENASTVAQLFQGLVERKHKVVVSTSSVGRTQTLSVGLVRNLKERIRTKRIEAPTKMYKTKQTLLPLVMRLG